MDLIRHLLTPPVFANEEQTRLARLLHWVLLAATGLNIFDMLILIVFAPETLPTFWTNAAFLVLTLISVWVMRHGMLRAASIVLCLSFWGLLTYYLSISGGVTSPAFGFLAIIIIFGAILLGTWGVLAFGLLCIVTATALYWAGSNGLLALAEGPPTPARLFATQTAIFLSLAVLMGMSERSVWESLTRAWRGERALAERNRQLQQESAERQRAQQEQARLAAILEATSDFVGISDTSGNLLYINRAARDFLGVTETIDTTGKNITDYLLPGTTDIILNEVIPAAIRDGIWSGETILLTHLRSEVPVSLVLIAHRSVDGSVEFVSAIVRDISDRKRAEQHQLELALTKGQFDLFKELLGNISHDLKTPISVINTSLYLLERLEDMSQRKEKIENIRRQTSLLAKFIEDLVTLTRLDGGLEFTFGPLDLNGLLSKVWDHMTPAAEDKQVTVRLQLDKAIPPILADERDLYRAMANLVENAVNYTPGGGSVVVQTYARDGGVIAQVSDTGIGISSDDLPHIFERFYRSEGARQFRSGGTGLGLAIVRRIIEIHTGKIELESTPGVGTTFRVWLPTSSRGSNAKQNGSIHADANP